MSKAELKAAMNRAKAALDKAEDIVYRGEHGQRSTDFRHSSGAAIAKIVAKNRAKIPALKERLEKAQEKYYATGGTRRRRRGTRKTRGRR